MTDTTPAANWRASGEQDPHAGQYDGERAALALGQLTDDELANAVYMGGTEPLNIERLLAKDPTYHSPIALLTAAKERIRWLSRTLEQALAQPAQVSAVRGGLDVAGDRIEYPVQGWLQPLPPEPTVECPHRCGAVYAKETYGAGFIEGSGMCPACDAAMPAKDIVRPCKLPDRLELTEDLKNILGRPNFTCTHIAEALRQMDYVIERKSEAEQAACLHWMLNHYLAHGADWKVHAEAELKAAAAAQGGE